jgi:alpha-tubulin suppressor-like RCC1 family protein
MNNILFIDKKVKDYHIFAESVNSETYPIIYSSDNSKSELLSLIENKFQKINRIGFVFDNKLIYTFVDNDPLFLNDESVPFSSNLQFIIYLINHYSVSNIDFLACNTLNYDNWKKYYEILQHETNVIVGASNNNTGNIEYGGDWVMESTNTDIEFIYFNKNIKYYKYLLGLSFNCFLIKNGGDILYACGDNGQGGLGIGNTTNQNVLVSVPLPSGKTVSRVANGNNNFAIVLMTDGTVYGTGYNGSGELGLGDNANRYSLTNIPLPSGKIASGVAAGNGHTLILMTDGTVYATGQQGFNGSTPLGIGVYNSVRTLTQMINTTGKTASNIYCSENTSYVLMSDRTLYGVGSGGQGQLGNGNYSDVQYSIANIPLPSGKLVKQVSPGGYWVTVVMTDGTVYATGANDQGTLGNGNTSWSSSFVQITFPAGKSVSYISSGIEHNLALMTDGTLYGWGRGRRGQLVNNYNPLIPTLITNSTGKIPVEIYCGYETSYMRMADGTVYAAGYGAQGQLGNGQNNNQSTFTSMLFNNSAVSNIASIQDNIIQLNTSITNFSIPIKTIGEGPFQIVDPNSNNTSPFAYTSSNTNVATITGKTVTIIGIGTTTITVSQNESANYKAGSSTTTFIVSSLKLALKSTSFNSDTALTKTFNNITFNKDTTSPKDTSYNNGNYTAYYTSVTTINSINSTYFSSVKTNLLYINLGTTVSSFSGADIFNGFTSLVSIFIPPTITSITSSAFSGCSSLTSMILPNVINIGASAFSGCSAITSVILPIVTTIGASAFSGCTNLIYMSLPGSLTNDISTFVSVDVGSVSLTNNSAGGITYTIADNKATVSGYNGGPAASIPIYVKIGNQKYPVTRIADNVFNDKSLTSVIIPPFITSIGTTFYNNQLTSVNLPPGLTSIGAHCFENNFITSVYFPSSLTNISESVFQNNRLVSINISPNLTTIGNYAFAYNYINIINNSTSIVFPSTIRSIGSYAFKSNQISTLTIPTNVNFNALTDGVFSYNVLQSITIPNNINSIGIEVFRNNSLTSFTLPNTITTISNSMFMANKFTTITIPSQITSIGPLAFFNCSATTLTFLSSTILTNIDESAFTYNQFESVGLPSSLRNIGSGAFSLGALKSITIPSNVETLGNSVFNGNQLTSVAFASPCKISHLPQSIFQSNLLTSVSIPSSVTSIGPYAFANNLLTNVSATSSLSIDNFSFYTNNLTPNLQFYSYITSLGYGAFYNNAASTINANLTDQNGLIYSSLRQDSNYSNIAEISGYNGTSTNVIIPFSITYANTIYNITSIANDTFKSKSLTAITMNMNITTIGNNAYASNNLSNNPNIPISIISIGNNAFQNNQLTSITIPSRIEYIGDYAFQNNKISSIITIPSSIKYLGQYAFQQNKLTSITLTQPSLIKTINSGLLKDNSLNSFTIPSSVTAINDYAFSNNILSSIDILNSNVVTIGSYAFEKNKLTSITIPNKITFIGQNAFQNNTLQTVLFTASSQITGLSDYLFANNQINTIQIPNTITTIGNNFLQNNSLTTLTLPSNLSYIGSYAFEKNSLVPPLSIPQTVSYIGSNAFASNNLVGVSGITFNGNNNTISTLLGENIFAMNNSDGTNSFVYIKYAYGKSWGTGLTPSLSSFDNNTINIKTQINKTVISVSIPSGASKIYDGTTNANSIIYYSLQGVLSGDQVSVNGVANFVDSLVGNNKQVNITNISISGSSASNYSLSSTTASANANIIPKSLTPIVNIIPKIYDTTTSASFTFVGSSSGVVSGDIVQLNGLANFSDNSAGPGKTVNITNLSLTGTAASNYILSTTSTTSTGTITKKPVFFSIPNKIYDGSSTIYNADLSGVYPGDLSSISFSGSVFFLNAVDVSQNLIVDTSNISLAGIRSSNYDPSYLKHPPVNPSFQPLTGNIFQKQLDISGIFIKSYDASTNVSNVFNLSGVIISDNGMIDLSYSTIQYDLSSVLAKNIIITAPLLTGIRAFNYTFNPSILYNGSLSNNGTSYTGFITKSGSITPKLLDISAIFVKTYDGSINIMTNVQNSIDLSGIIPVDVGKVDISYNDAFYNTYTAGSITVTLNGVYLKGDASKNYTVSNNIVNGKINPLNLNMNITSYTKPYDSTTQATVIINLTNKINNDIVSVNYVSSVFDSANVGTNKRISISGITLVGTDKDNYTILNTTATFNNSITPFQLNKSDIYGFVNNKYYYNTKPTDVAASVIFALNNIFPTDVGSLDLSYSSAVFPSTPIPPNTVLYDNINYLPVVVNGLNLIGTARNNYSLNTTTIDLSGRYIFAEPIKLQLRVNDFSINKIYDGTPYIDVSLSVKYPYEYDYQRHYSDVSNVFVYYPPTSSYFYNNNVLIGNASVGTDKKIFINNIQLTGSNSYLYSVDSSLTVVITELLPVDISEEINTKYVTGEIFPKQVDISRNRISKTYDGTTVSSSAIISLSGIIPFDINSVSATGNVNFFTAPAGEKPLARVSNIILTGSKKSNYYLSTTTIDLSGIINRRQVGINGTTKTYDGSTNYPVSNFSLTNIVLGDTVNINGSSGYTDASNVTISTKAYLINPYLYGDSSNNYNIPPNLSAIVSIARRQSTLKLRPKIYDGSNTVYPANIDLSNIIHGDDISVNFVGKYNSIYVGNNSAYISNAILFGKSVKNYTILSPQDISGAISRRPLSVSVSQKIYDGSKTAYFHNFSLQNVINIDIGNVRLITGSGIYDSKNVGNRKVNLKDLSLNGPASFNYVIDASMTVDASINKLEAIIAIIPKIYNTTTSSNLNNIYVVNKFPSDIVRIDGSASYDSSFVGNRQVDVSYLSLVGNDSANYSLSNALQKKTIDGSINPYPLLMVVSDKTYDGTTTISELSLKNISRNIIGIYPQDSGKVSISGALQYNNNIAQVNKPIDIELNLTKNNVYLTGDSSINYYIYRDEPIFGNILPRRISFEPSVNPKIYDGYTDANVVLDISGLVSNDIGYYNAFYKNANYNNSQAGSSKPINVYNIYLTGSYPANYVFDTYLNSSGDIHKKHLTIYAKANSKVYDGTTTAYASYILNGIVNRDVINISGDASFNDRNVGVNKLVTASNFVLTGPSVENYEIPNMSISIAANITAANLIPSIESVSNKTYDGSLNTTGTIYLSGRFNEDDVSANAIFTFVDPYAGNSKRVDVSNIILYGRDALNYKLKLTDENDRITDISGISNISPLLLKFPNNSSKIYDGTTNFDISNITIYGINNQIQFNVGGTAKTDTPSVGSTSLQISNVYLIGDSSTNYIINEQDLSAIILKSIIRVSVADASYNSTNKVDISNVVLNGIQNNDDIYVASINASYSNNGVVGKSIPINISSIAIGGSLSSQYDISYSNTTGNITPAPLTITASASSKIYDGSTYTNASLQIINGIFPGDNVVINNYNANFTTPDIGDNKTVIVNNIQLGGASNNNYIARDVSATANILFNPKIKYCAPTTSSSSSSCIIPNDSNAQTYQTNPNVSRSMKYSNYVNKNTHNLG